MYERAGGSTQEGEGEDGIQHDVMWKPRRERDAGHSTRTGHSCAGTPLTSESTLDLPFPWTSGAVGNETLSFLLGKWKWVDFITHEVRIPAPQP